MLGLGPALADVAVVRPHGVAFSPLSLSPSAWYDPSDLTTLFKDTAGTTPVTADGDAVARINDKSGNGYHLLQSTAGARPLYKTSGGLSWLQADGVDDTLGVSGVSFAGSSMTAVAAVRAIAHANFGRIWSLSAAASNDFDNAASAAAVLMASAAAGFSGFRSSELSTGALAAGSDVVIQSRFNNTDHVLRMNGVDKTAVASSGTFNIVNMGLFSAGGASPANARFYGGGIIMRVLTSGEKAALDTYLGTKSGLVL